MWLVDPADPSGKRLSDIAIIDNTLPELDGMSQCVCDWFVRKVEQPPEPTPEPPDLVQAIRNAAWNQLGIPYNPDAAFAKYARAQKLGNPVTTEFDAEGYRAQGFAGAIVYAKIGDWANIQQLAW
jgi:hypothetical protein